MRALAFWVFWVFAGSVCSASIPEALRPWESWALWGQAEKCPSPYDNAEVQLTFWPSRLAVSVDAGGGRFDGVVAVYRETWMPLPGGRGVWPQNVTANGAVIPVVEKDGRPVVWLGPGVYQIAGTFPWKEIPENLAIPQEIGLLALTLEGQPVENPVWDEAGLVWFKRGGAASETDENFLGVKVFALLEDGIPLWLRTEVELLVSGENREETLGGVLPAGWKLASVESPLPVAVDEEGRMKVQVRPGKWTVRMDAFRLDDSKELIFAEGVQPAMDHELVGFRARPDFRMVDIVGVPSIDVSQTTFPERWRSVPVYRWETETAFRWEERLRGMGSQKPQGLTVRRTLWLDEDGKGLTFRDEIRGEAQQIWRLDAAPGLELGSVQSGGTAQLITRNPASGAPGVEIRTRTLNLEATGRAQRSEPLYATGWRADADSVSVLLNLPPGWRLFALFGSDWVQGDWLTAWTLLDLFLLLIFTVAVFRLWGFAAALLAFLAFGLSYHEPNAPRFAWLMLLIPVALLRVVPAAGWARRLLVIWKALAVLGLVLILTPFLSKQVQQAIYPQLEVVPGALRAPVSESASASLEMAAPAADVAAKVKGYSSGWGSPSLSQGRSADRQNLLYDAKARIQTGPGIPDWTWRAVQFGWRGPVSENQVVRPVLIPVGVERVLTVLRIASLLLLAGVLLRAVPKPGRWQWGRKAAAAAVMVGFAGAASTGHAQFPEESLLNTLRERLLEPPKVFPHAADISNVILTLDGRRLTMEAEVHALALTAVPLPGRLASWSPVSVSVEGAPDVAVRRDGDVLWIALTPGVHKVRVEGILAEVTEWEWSFRLKPHRVAIHAPGWTVSGVGPEGIPEAQVLFTLQQKSEGGAATYERQDLFAVAEVERTLELGLVWQVRTTVKRLSPVGRALEMKIPLLPGENVLTSPMPPSGGVMEVRLGAQDRTFSWESELRPADQIELATRPGDSWVERWKLIVSPVWNVTLTGLAPVFEPNDPELIPVWRPWPGESVQLGISRPEAIPGATVTVDKGTHVIQQGARQRVSRLDLSVRCSLGEDFRITLPVGAEVTSLSLDGAELPVRVDAGKVVIPLRPGAHALSLGWRTQTPLTASVRAEPVGLPVESANIETIVEIPENRWILWTDGPLRGPAVRFWMVFAVALLAAGILSRISSSPLRWWEWVFLAVGLIQTALPAALLVIGWLFFLAWRGQASFQTQPPLRFNFLQVVLIVLTIMVLGVFISVVAEGLLGRPEMFIAGNGSTRSALRWYQARCGTGLPQPSCISISIWWYRVLMLVWALWLALALIRWLQWGWTQFSAGGCFRRGAPRSQKS